MSKQVAKMKLYEFPNLKIEVYKTQGNATWKNLCHLRITPKGTKTYEHMVRYDRLLRGTDELEVLRYFNRCLTDDDLKMLRDMLINICNGQHLKHLTRYEGYSLNEILHDLANIIGTLRTVVSYTDDKYIYVRVEIIHDIIDKRKDVWITTRQKVLNDLTESGKILHKHSTDIGYGEPGDELGYYAFPKEIGDQNE